MAPLRGGNKKKMKVEKIDVVQKALPSGSSEDGFADWWADFSKRISGSFSPPKEVDDMFKFVFRMSRKTFKYVYSLVLEPLSKTKKYSFSDGTVISLHDKVAIALRRLKSGDSLVSLGEAFGIHRSIVSQITWSFVEALEENGLHHLKWPETDEEMSYIKAKFERIHGLPNCCGAVDITHIKMMSSSPPLDTEVWVDNMNNQSMLLQAIVDSDMRFRDVVSGWPGKMTDSSVLSSSTFFKLCEKGNRLNGNKMKLSDNSEISEYIVGDSGFPSLPWLITPYQGKDISESASDFNRRHYETWRVVHRALTRLKEEWKLLQAVMWRPDKNKLPRIILACCVLYNIFLDIEDEVHYELPTSQEHDPGYLQQVFKSPDKTSSDLREKLSLYVSGKLQPQVVSDSDHQVG